MRRSLNSSCSVLPSRFESQKTGCQKQKGHRPVRPADGLLEILFPVGLQAGPRTMTPMVIAMVTTERLARRIGEKCDIEKLKRQCIEPIPQMQGSRNIKLINATIPSQAQRTPLRGGSRKQLPVAHLEIYARAHQGRATARRPARPPAWQLRGRVNARTGDRGRVAAGQWPAPVSLAARPSANAAAAERA